MKKAILNLTFAVMSLFAFSATAQQPSCGQPCGDNCGEKCEEKCECACCDAKPCKGDSVAVCAQRPRCPERPCPFEGIELTDAQKEQLKAIMPQQPQCDKNNGQCGRQPQSAPVACDDFLAKVKEILTPEQYVKFLENIVKNDQPRHHRGPRHHARRVNGQCGRPAPQPCNGGGQPQGCCGAGK